MPLTKLGSAVGDGTSASATKASNVDGMMGTDMPNAGAKKVDCTLI